MDQNEKRKYLIRQLLSERPDGREYDVPEDRAVRHDDKITIGKTFIEIAKQYGMTIRPCAEGNEFEAYGADCSGCMTVNTYETALDTHLNVPKKGRNQRNGECACLLGTDI